MNVRTAQPRDLPVVSRLYFQLNPARRRRGKITSLEGSLRTRVFVAEEGRRVLGFAWANLVQYANTHVGYIEELYVQGPHRRRGIGSALVTRALRWFAEAEVEVVFVSTSAGDRVAQLFYHSLGFRRTRGPWFWWAPSPKERATRSGH